jgi:tripartite-type tricarboxylate transporter receptor subunit TctC
MRTLPVVMSLLPRLPSNRAIWAFLFALSLFSGPGAATAAGYPEKPVSIIVPFAVGTATDSIVRLLAKGLHAKLGVPFIVENRPGASGIIGTDRGARSKPDGYTLLAASGTTMSQNPWFFKKIPYDPATDFKPIARIGGFPLAIVVRQEAPWKTMAEFLDAARTTTKSFSYGTAYGMQTVCGELLKKNAKLDLISVPYKGTPQAITDLLGGQIDFMCAEFATSLNAIRGHQLRALAILTDKRSHYLPDVPTMKELGLNFLPEMHSWIGLLAPSGTSTQNVETISRAVLEIAAAPEFSGALDSIGFELATLNASDFGKFLKKDHAIWGEQIKQAGIAPQ